VKTKLLLVAAALALSVVATACLPANPGPTGLYLGKQANISPAVTPKANGIVWGSAPNIDEHYGGTLYEGTGIEQQDPRPPLVDGKQPLRLWVADPRDGRTGRPAIIWLHGGGFAVGLDSMYGLANGTGKAYAQRGYVGFSVEYRTDTTLVGTGDRPPSLCQWVQDHIDLDDPTWQARRAQCQRNIQAAQFDALAAVRWVRLHAAQYGVDPNKIAVGGFSAGAVTAMNVAYDGRNVGGNAYWSGDDRASAKSKVQAAFGASGCVYSPDLGVPSVIDTNDAPTAMIASKGDPAVPYACVAATTKLARSNGLVAELASYCSESAHANTLYEKHLAATDAQWTTFLARELAIYSGMPKATTAPTCT
jgi:acetyl esterase/lipase